MEFNNCLSSWLHFSSDIFSSPDTIKDLIKQMRGELKSFSVKIETLKVSTAEDQSTFSEILISTKFTLPVSGHIIKLKCNVKMIS